jgi:hypothetical protein
MCCINSISFDCKFFAGKSWGRGGRHERVGFQTSRVMCLEITKGQAREMEILGIFRAVCLFLQERDVCFTAPFSINERNKRGTMKCNRTFHRPKYFKILNISPPRSPIRVTI